MNRGACGLCESRLIPLRFSQKPRPKAGRQWADLGGAPQHLWYVRVAMLLIFPYRPFVAEEPPLAVWLQGVDTDTGGNVDCRVISTVLTQHCGAGGVTNQDLLRAFNEHRARIENMAQRKYDAGQVERLNDRIVVWLHSADF